MKEEIEKSSGNLYADLGRKNAQEMHSKAALARTIYKIIKQKKLSQTKAAALLGLTQSSLSKLLQGKISGFSTDRLLRILNQLGHDVDIKVKPIKAPRRNRSVRRTAVFVSEDRIDLEDARKALAHAEKNGTVSWNTVKKKLGL